MTKICEVCGEEFETDVRRTRLCRFCARIPKERRWREHVAISEERLRKVANAARKSGMSYGEYVKKEKQ